MRPAAAIPKLFSILEKCGPQHWWPGETPLEVVVGAILTQNTSWINVEKAILALKLAHLLPARDQGDEIFIQRWISIPVTDLAQWIRPSGYFNVKANRLLNFMSWLSDRFGSLTKMFELPVEELRSELLVIKGIGPETADSILLYAGGKPVFVIDAYTKRILIRHNLAHPGSRYSDLQKLFMNYLKKDVMIYNEFHALLVLIGKNYCRKTNPKCTICPLNRWNGHRPTMAKQ